MQPITIFEMLAMIVFIFVFRKANRHNFSKCQRLFCFSKMIAVILFRKISDYKFPKSQQLDISNMSAIIVFCSYSFPKCQHLLFSAMSATITFRIVRKYDVRSASNSIFQMSTSTTFQITGNYNCPHCRQLNNFQNISNYSVPKRSQF